ncbi:MAG: hypothetical protein AB8F94_27195 [Saprospiraceae bacterium]
MRTISILLFTIILFFSCKPDDEPAFEGDVILTIEGELFYPLLGDGVFLSDKNGETLVCKMFDSSDPIELRNRIPMTDDYFDLNILTYKSNSNNSIKIETYPNVQTDKWRYKLNLSSNNSEPVGQVVFLADDLVDNIEYGIINGSNSVITSFANLKDEGFALAKFWITEGYIFLRLKLIGEDQYRYIEFNNLSDNDTIQLDIQNYPIGFLENLISNQADSIRVRNLTGLNNNLNFNNSSGIFSQNGTINNYRFPTGKVWYPEGVFESFYVALEVFRDSFYLYKEHKGQAVYDYSPTLPELKIEGSGVNSFRAKSAVSDPDFLSVTWIVNNPQGNIEWKVFQKAEDPDFLKLPKIPTCILPNQNWFSRSDFRLKSIDSYNYENFNSYDEYIDSRYGNSPGGEYNELILIGGDFERKSLLIN